MSLKAKLLSELIDKLNAIPELEGKGEEAEGSADALKLSEVDPEAEEEEAEGEAPEMAEDFSEEDMEEDPFAKLKGRPLMIKKKMGMK